MEKRVSLLVSMAISGRKKRGITQEAMAKAFGIHVKTYRRRERGDMRLSEFLKLCDLGGIRLMVLGEEMII